MDRTAAGCGTRYGAFRRYVVVAHGLQEQRLVVQQLCGTRACKRCDKAIRLRECARVSGPWTQFHTLGFPPNGISVRQGWFRIGRARDLLFKRLESAIARGRDDVIRVSQDARDRADAIRDAVYKQRRRLSPLDYAWCLEPHQSGFPHLHFVTNTQWLDYRWLRAVWSECIGRVVLWSKTIEVWDPSGVCYYMSAYISKTTLTLDLCAVMYRQRLWGTSLPMKPRKREGWMIDRETTEEQAAEEALDETSFRDASKWHYVMGKESGYRLWTREWVLDAEDGPETFLRGSWRQREPEDKPPPNESGWKAFVDPLWAQCTDCHGVITRTAPMRWTLTRTVKVH